MLRMKRLVSGVRPASHKPASASSDTATDWFATGYSILCNLGWGHATSGRRYKQRNARPASDHTIYWNRGF